MSAWRTSTGASSLRDHRAWEIARGPEETLGAALGMLDRLLGDTGAPDVWAVAVGVPGPVDFEHGTPVAPPIMPGWNGFDVRSRFEARLGAPTWVDNDVNLLALAERARRGDDAIDLSTARSAPASAPACSPTAASTAARTGRPGDIGHVRLARLAARCRCGKRGCLEAEAGGWAIVRDAEHAFAAGADGQSGGHATPLTPEAVAVAAMNGDPLAISLVAALRAPCRRIASPRS